MAASHLNGFDVGLHPGPGENLIDIGATVAKARSTYRCEGCGHRSAKWMGRCPGCGAWNRFIEERADTVEGKDRPNRAFRLPGSSGAPELQPLSDVVSARTVRQPTGIGELDRVLGGGLVPGSLVVVGGDPGIGKSTLLLTAMDRVAAQAGGSVIYVTGEESPEQVRLRAERLGVDPRSILILAETRADRIAAAAERVSVRALVIDSIQAVYEPTLESAPGSVSQIREVAARFLYLAKAKQLPTFLVGHVTKDGALAGPRLLEHMVDTVLYFESSSGQPYRILRAHKNRFGSTNEIGVFEMRARGLAEVQNPSELFLAERPIGSPGSVVLPALEGTRPLLVEVQALVSPTSLGNPRRTCLGFDPNRAALLVAVLERRAGLDLLGCDVFVNVAGGVTVREPAADLGVATALASSLRDRALDPRTLVFGELGLTGELRGVAQAGLRLKEGAKLGFLRAVVPRTNATLEESTEGIEIVGVSRLDEALDAALSG